MNLREMEARYMARKRYREQASTDNPYDVIDQADLYRWFDDEARKINREEEQSL